MANPTRISDAEWEVMEVLWEESPLTSSKIIKRIQPYKDWNSKTIHTLISRLAHKNIVGVDKTSPNKYLYYPLISKEKCRLQETENFLQKVYDGSLSMLVANFVEENKLSSEEIESLKKLLDRENGKQGNS